MIFNLKSLLLLVLTCWIIPTLSKAQEKENAFTLQEAQAYALEHNYGIQNAQKDVLAAKRKIWETTAIGLPQVSAEGTFQKFIDIPVSLAPANSFNPNAPEGALTELQFGLEYNNTLALTASQLVFDGSYIVGLQAAKTYKELSINNETKTKIELNEAVAQAYYTVLIAEENTKTLQSSLTVVKSMLLEAEALYKEGLIEEQSVDQLQLTVNELTTSVGIAKGQIDFAKKLLQLQMGTDIGAPMVLSDNLDTFLSEIITLPEQKEFNVENHIDYSLVTINSKLMQLNHKKEKFSFLPSVNLFFSHQQQNMNNEFDAFSGGRYYPSTVVGASIRMPILTSGSRLAKMSQAKIEWEKAINQQKEAEQGLIYQSQLANSNLETANETYLNQKENMDLAKKIYDKTIRKYNEGMVSSMELSQAQNQYLTAEGKYIKSLLDLFTAKSELKKSYGGQ